MTTENLSFYGPPNPDIGEITCNAQETPRGSRKLLALVRLGPAGSLYLYEPEKARDLLTAAFAALQILDPEGADDALSDLLDAGALNKILRRIAQAEGRGSDVQPDRVYYANRVDVSGPPRSTPVPPPPAQPELADVAQPEDIPLPPRDVAAGADPLAIPANRIAEPNPAHTCARCGAAETDVPMRFSNEGYICHNSGACGRRQQAHDRIAGAR